MTIERPGPRRLGGWGSWSVVNHWLILPVVAVAAVESVFFFVVMSVFPCGVFGECPAHIWRTPGIYVALLAGLAAAVVTGALFAFVPWARTRFRSVTGAVLPVAWLVLTVVMLARL